MAEINPNRYLVVIGDVIGSRQIEDRGQLQRRLSEMLEALNQRKDAPLSPYTITLGDEFQAVYRQPESLFQHAFSVMEKAHPHRIRFSFGLGRITTAINRKQSLGMDGEAFYRAREGMDWIKDQRADYHFILQGLPDQQQADLLNNTLFLISNLLSGWQYNRTAVLRRRLENQPVKTIARNLEISETAVYRNIYDGSLREIIRLFELITQELEVHLGGSER